MAERSSTTSKQPGGVTGKGFVKGDPRINRHGRPRTFDATRELAQAIATEKARSREGGAVVVEGHAATTVEAILRMWAASGDFRKQQAFMEYAYGKPPQTIEVGGASNPVKVVVEYVNKRRTSDTGDNGETA